MLTSFAWRFGVTRLTFFSSIIYQVVDTSHFHTTAVVAGTIDPVDAGSSFAIINRCLFAIVGIAAVAAATGTIGRISAPCTARGSWR